LKDEDKKFPPSCSRSEVLKDGTVETDCRYRLVVVELPAVDIIARLHSEGDA